jgi:hypothetical protein
MPAHSLPRIRLALVLAATLGLANAASAAPADVALLQSYAGNYTGMGTLSGATGSTLGSSMPQAVRCRLSLQPAAGGKVNYTGRCSLSGASFSMSGIFAFTGGHFVAAMSSSSGETASVIGQKRNGGVVFTSKQQDVTGGRSRTVSSSLTLARGTLQVDFTAVDDKTGAVTSGSIPFTKS